MNQTSVLGRLLGAHPCYQHLYRWWGGKGAVQYTSGPRTSVNRSGALELKGLRNDEAPIPHPTPCALPPPLPSKVMTVSQGAFCS